MQERPGEQALLRSEPSWLGKALGEREMRPASKQPAHSCGKVKRAAEPRKDILKSLLFILFFFEHKSFLPKEALGAAYGRKSSEGPRRSRPVFLL